MATQTTQRMDSSQIAQMFAARLPERGGWISVNQAAWLFGVWEREVRHACPYYRRSTPLMAYGLQVNGQAWMLTIAPNGAGMLKPEF